MIALQNVFFLLVVTSLLMSCSTSSSKKDYGNSMQSVGGKAQELGDKWDEGGDLISEGNKLIKQSQVDKVKGENMVKKGMQIQAESERVFKETYQRVYQSAPSTNPERFNPAEFSR